MSELADRAARERIRRDLGATLFVEAAAGTGKTTELIERILSMLREGRGTLDRMVAVTFTEKAAGEMKLRLREEIEKARLAADDADVKSRLDLALSHLEIARIGTIHAFCAELLKERPVEAGVDPLFEVCAEDESEAILALAFETWFESLLAAPPEGVKRILRRRPRAPNADGPRDQLRNALRSLVEHRDFPAAWKKDAFDRENEVDDLMAHLAEVGTLAAEAKSPDDWLAKNLLELREFADEVALRETVRRRDYDGLEAELGGLLRSRRIHWHWRGNPRSPYAPGLARETVIAAREALKERLEAFRDAADAHLAACLHEELLPAIEIYETQKLRAGKLDFLDLLLKARSLIERDTAVRAELRRRFTHFFVDEFQDTDPLQVDILLLLSSTADGPEGGAAAPLPGKLFLVGDPKQSIYRFRRADIAIYEATKRRLCASGAEVIHLTTSFRSVPSIQAAVNAAFAPEMPGASDAQAEYVALERARPEQEGQPAVVALPVPAPYGDFGSIVKWKIEESFPVAAAAFVDWLVKESGWTVHEREGGERVPIAPRHVCFLFRRLKQFRDDVTRPYVRALEARRLPHVLVGGQSFHEREEVLAVRNALNAIEWPDDELRVYATLRGPFFGMGDDMLLAYRHRFRSLHPMRKHDDDALDESEHEVADALGLLARLHAGRNRRPVADTIASLLEAARAHAGIAIWPTGEQALANCLRVIDIARRFERRGASSFRAFVEMLEADAERGATRDAPLVEEGTEGVRIMTVHKAKGLEFPVVVLADPTCRAIRDTPTRHVDAERALWAEPICGCAPRDLLDARESELARDREEAIRLAYVAATRARDLLVVPVNGDVEMEGWLEVLNPVVYPRREARKNTRPAPGCPAFGYDSVLERPGMARVEPGDSVAPGLHRPRGGETHEVVWWDPRTLDLDEHQSVGLRQSRILEADKKGVVADAGIAAHQRWQRRREERLAAGAMASLVPRPITELAEERAAGDEAPRIEVFEARADREARPRGKRFGTLVHAVLAVVDLDADRPAIEALAAAQGRLLGSSPAEVAAAAAAVRNALSHPVLERARASATAGGLHRETPVLMPMDETGIAEGVVDLAFREARPEGARWVVVDFKTDADLEARRAAYEAQVRLYMEGITAATGEPAEGVLLVV